MAITFRGAASNSVINGGTPTIDLTTIAGLAFGDVVVACCRTGGAGGAGTGTTPAGWTTITNSTASTPRVWCYKVMGVSPDTSVAFWAAGTASDAGAATALAFSGVSPTAVLDVAFTLATSIDPGSVTPASNDCAVVVLSSVTANDSSPGTMTNYTVPAGAAVAGNDTNPASSAGAYRILSGGAGVAENPATWSALTSSSAQTVTIALRPRVVETAVVDAGAVTLAGKTVTVRDVERLTVTKATVTLTGKTVTVGDTELVPVAKAAVTIAGQSVDIVEVTSIIPVTAATVLLTGKTVNIVDSTPSFDVVSVSNALVAFAGKTVTVSDFPTVIAVASATIALTGKPVTIRETNTILVNQASVTFAGKTVTVSTSTFQDIPKYIIRGRGSRHELWTQSYGGTIKGRGSRAFLVMR